MKIKGYEIKPRAYLRGADLSGAKGILSQSRWMNTNFKSNKHGFIVYKDVMSTFFTKPYEWKFKEECYLTENCNFNRTDSCGCGVNFATIEWLKNNSHNEIWECLIEWKDACGICVPYNTDGKARCERLKLVKKL